MILSFNTVILTQSLTSKTESTNPGAGKEEPANKEEVVKKQQHSVDSTQSLTVIAEKVSNEKSDTDYFTLKSQSGVFSFFDEIMFYWFHQL